MIEDNAPVRARDGDERVDRAEYVGDPPPLTAEERAQLKANWDRVHEAVDDACVAAGRQRGDVEVLPVTKYTDAAVCRALVELGAHSLGESRVQDIQAKAQAPGLEDFHHWHLIGHLQRNKARRAALLCELIHTVDSLRLAETLDRIAAEENLGSVHALLEVKLATEEAKTGCPPEQLLELIEDCKRLKHIYVAGLMTIPTYTENPEGARPTFARLRELRDEYLRPHAMLSMGMSHDFAVAIAEGATTVRIGSAFVEGLDRPA